MMDHFDSPGYIMYDLHLIKPGKDHLRVGINYLNVMAIIDTWKVG